jgi:hypothetical protein
MRLAITGARLAMGSFSTDRGLRTVPVWAFTVHGVKRPVRVRSLSGSLAFLAPMSWAGESATVSDNGRRIRLSFVGGLAGNKPCDVSYTAGSVAHSHAVAVWLTEHPVKAAGGDVICSAAGTAAPLSSTSTNRSARERFVESFGAPVSVCRGRQLPPIGEAESCHPGEN